MEENEVIDPNYLKGFNEGYIIAKHLPEMADKLLPKDSKSPRSDGFKDGKIQFDMEQSRDNYPAWLGNDRLSSLDRSQNFSKEKDDLDKD